MVKFNIIFDLDGTLADTLRDIAQAVNVALASLSLPTHSTAKYRQWVGSGWKNTMRQAAEVSEDDLEQLCEAAFQYYKGHLTDNTRLYDGVAEVLGELSRRRVGMAVLSNKPHDLTVATVTDLGCAERFAAVQGAVDEQMRKPDPATALRLAAVLGSAPREVYLVGDSSVDVATARNGGMVPVAVTWGFRDRSELVEAGAERIVDRAAELLSLPGRGG